MDLAQTQLNWDKLVEERNDWVAYNFPDPDGKRTPLDSVLGVIEELGELTHHHLKQAQSIRGLHGFHEEEAKDAVGDLTVYLLGVMSFYDVRPHSNPIYYGDQLNADLQVLELAYRIGRLAFYHTGRMPIPEAMILVSTITYHMRCYCKSRGWDYEQLVQTTWDQVKQRDWRKYPHDGLTR